MSVFTAPEQMCQPKSMNFVRKMYVGTRIPSVEPHGLARGFSQYRLQPENDTMDPIIVSDVSIIGKVVGAYRSF